jgi:hypothetical protein
MSRWGAWIALLALCVAGCRPSLPKPSVVPAKGTVTLKGKPLSLGYLTLHQKTGSAEYDAIVDKDGKFAFRTFGVEKGKEDGVPPGEYKLSVHEYDGTKCGAKPPGVTPTPGKEIGKYKDAETSEKTVTIPSSGDENMKIDLD